MQRAACAPARPSPVTEPVDTIGHARQVRVPGRVLQAASRRDRPLRPRARPTTGPRDVASPRPDQAVPRSRGAEFHPPSVCCAVSTTRAACKAHSARAIVNGSAASCSSCCGPCSPALNAVPAAPCGSRDEREREARLPGLWPLQHGLQRRRQRFRWRGAGMGAEVQLTPAGNGPQAVVCPVHAQMPAQPAVERWRRDVAADIAAGWPRAVPRCCATWRAMKSPGPPGGTVTTRRRG